jgi:hypothetical protein
VKQGTWRWAGAMAAMLLVGACVPHVDETPIHDERPIGSPRTVEEHQEAEPEIKASLSDNTVTVKAWQRTECRSTTTTPVEKEEGVGHSLHNGALAQTVNLAMAGLLIATGVVVYAAANGSCTNTPNATASNPNPSPVPCTADQQQRQSTTTQGLGILTAGTAVLPLGAFVWNIFRAQDDTKTEAARSATSTDWKVCAAKPLANTPITLTAGGVTVTGQTDDRGEATLDASPIASAASDPQNGTVETVAGGKRASAAVSLADSPMYVAWQRGPAAAGAAASKATASLDDQLQAWHACILSRLDPHYRWDPDNCTQVSCHEEFAKAGRACAPKLEKFLEATAWSHARLDECRVAKEWSGCAALTAYLSHSRTCRATTATPCFLMPNGVEEKDLKATLGVESSYDYNSANQPTAWLRTDPTHEAQAVRVALTTECRLARSLFACDHAVAVVQDMPPSSERDDLAAVVAAARPKLDEVAWQEPEVQACAKSQDCGWVTLYLERFPRGAHASEAHRLLSAANQQREALAKAEAAERARKHQTDCYKLCYPQCLGNGFASGVCENHCENGC